MITKKLNVNKEDTMGFVKRVVVTSDMCKCHVFLFVVTAFICCRVRCDDTSWKILTDWYSENWLSTENLINLTPFMRRMCPRRCFLIATTGPQGHVWVLASACVVRNLLSHRVLDPFNITSVRLVSDQTSHSYVNNEQTTVLYIFKYMCECAHALYDKGYVICHIPHCSLSSTVKIEPKYLNTKVFLSFVPSQSTFCFRFWTCNILFCLTSQHINTYDFELLSLSFGIKITSIRMVFDAAGVLVRIFTSGTSITVWFMIV